MTQKLTQAESATSSTQEVPKGALVLRDTSKLNTAIDPITATTRSHLTATLADQRNLINTKATLRALGKMYNYHPKSSAREKIKLDIDWGKIEGGSTPKLLGRYDEYTKDSPGVMTGSPWTKKPFLFWEVEFIQEETPRDTPEREEEFIKFTATKRIHEYKDGTTPKEDMLQLHLRRERPNMLTLADMEHQYVSDFDFVRKEKDGHEEWNMKHRRTSEVYRDQGIASHMMGITERFLQARAKEKQLPQILTASVGQADALIWLLNSGFTSATQEDQENIDRIFQGDPDLILVSGASEEGRSPRRWYIFERSQYYDENGRQKPGIWAKKNYGKPIHYFNSSLRVQLKKEF